MSKIPVYRINRQTGGYGSLEINLFEERFNTQRIVRQGPP